MTPDQTYRLKTFALAAVLLLATIVAVSTWFGSSAPLAPGMTTDAPQQSSDNSNFAQSGGVVADECPDAS